MKTKNLVLSALFIIFALLVAINVDAKKPKGHDESPTNRILTQTFKANQLATKNPKVTETAYLPYFDASQYKSPEQRAKLLKQRNARLRKQFKKERS